MKRILIKARVYHIVFLCVLIFGCSNNDDSYTAPTPSTPAADKRELISAKPWRYVAWVANPPVKDDNGKLIGDIHNNKPSCDQDDLLIFNANGNVNFDQGPTKCDSATPQSSFASWAFIENETKLDMANRVYTLDALTATELKISFDDKVGNTTHRHTVTFNH